MDIIELIKVIIIGIVEGITEWLPISSTGHMLLVDEFIHMNVTPEFRECSCMSFSSARYWRS